MLKLLYYARLYKSYGLSIVPVNNFKKSIGYWQKYQKRIMTDEELSNAFINPDTTGIAIVCGAISQNLEVIDMDSKYDLSGNLFDRFVIKLDRYSPQLLHKLVIGVSRNGGFHFIYRCKQIGNYCALARRPSTKQELYLDPNTKFKTLIEGLGNGRYTIMFPTSGYEFIQRSLKYIPLINVADRNLIHKIAISFNEYNILRPIVARKTRYFSDDLSPFHDYNKRGDFMALLQKHGWVLVKETSEKSYFRRPGKTDHETSGDFHHALGLFSVFTPNTLFEPNTGYQPYAIFAILECNGNFRLAAKKLLEEGYGVPYKSR